jgi:hypothetical protein
MKKILFNDKYGLTEAVLNGTKTMTRRFISSDFTGGYKYEMDDHPLRVDEYRHLSVSNNTIISYFPKYKIGEIIAIAQSYKDCGYDGFDEIENDKIHTPNGLPTKYVNEEAGWNNKMFVKSSLMKHHIEITGVYIEKLNDISDDDCLKEGISRITKGDKHYLNKNICARTDGFGFGDCKTLFHSLKTAYSYLIDAIGGKGTWGMNQYVFVYSFKLID